MKNKTMALDNNRLRIGGWMGQDMEDDDFLAGKVPQDQAVIWEDEE